MRQIPGYPLWIGNASDVSEMQPLFDVGIEAIVDLAGNPPPAKLPRQFLYCRIPILMVPATRLGYCNWR